MKVEPSSSQSDPPTEKKKRVTRTTLRKGKGKGKAIDLTAEDDAQVQSPPSKKKKGASPRKAKDEEKRLRRFRQHVPSSYLEKLNRATTQRMFVVDRTRGGTDEIPEETIDMAGTTGNIYNITISRLPSCTCPDNQKGNQCKHIVYVLHNVLKAPEHLQYQLAFLSSELREIFAAAPTPASSETSADADSPSNRKEVSGNCPICFTEFEPETEEIVWCKAACGNNLHKTCFEQWAKSQSEKEGDEDSIKRIKNSGQVNGEGYVNVAGELGLSGAREYSTYHQHWVRRQGFGYY
ncbi:hypothetical protein OEA41_003223 [Lepraria neglecta]|uniref:SWIM-type domain-containing protein n=1 Tax=Lepraria neglecta TaxID=209136 RepID=A0AAD9Z462_9LECA|nr:hypothetical protein OEA41_003223 [Lepraria neglecta]